MWKVAIAALPLLTNGAAGQTLFAAPLEGTPPGGEATPPQALLDEQAGKYLSDPCRAGVSIVAQVAGKTYFSNRGVSDRSTKQTPTPDSVYELASVTKTFAGALAAKAVLEKRLTLDGDFRSYLPAAYPNLATEGSPITLRTLASHSSGLQRDLPDSDALFANLDYSRIGNQIIQLNRRFSRAGDLNDLHAVQLRSSPGETFAYSNLGVRLIGYGLETVYREPFKRLLQRSILKPLSMRSTGLELTRSMWMRAVKPYGRSGAIQPFHDRSAGAAYGLYSTPRDMGRYLAWQLNETQPIVAQAHALIRGSADEGQAMIWNVGREDGQRVLWHGGGSFGQTSQMVLFPDRQLGFVLLANDSCAGSEAAMKALAISASKKLAPTISALRTSSVGDRRLARSWERRR